MSEMASDLSSCLLLLVVVEEALESSDEAAVAVGSRNTSNTTAMTSTRCHSEATASFARLISMWGVEDKEEVDVVVKGRSSSSRAVLPIAQSVNIDVVINA